MEYGSENEQTAIQCFEEKTGLKVEPCGLFIHEIYGFLGASPDGVIDNDFIVEVKCPKSAKNLTVSEASQKIKNFCIDKKTMKLNKKSNYYYQIQGQLQISNRKNCYFIIWTEKDLYYEIINRDDNFWELKMLKKLIFCYEEVLLPEMLDPRLTRSLEIREPNIVQHL